MQATNNISKLFSVSGCISPKGIQQYIAGELTVAEKELVDLHLSTCELCADAVSGYQQRNDPEKVTHAIIDINRQLHQRFLRIHTRNSRELAFVSVFSTAATVILLTGLFYLMKQRELYRERLMAYSLQDSVAISDRTIGQPEIYMDESANVNKAAGSGIHTEIMSSKAKEANIGHISKQEKVEKYHIAFTDEFREEHKIIDSEPLVDTMIIAAQTNPESDISVVAYAAKSSAREKNDNYKTLPAEKNADYSVSAEVSNVVEEMPGFMGGDINKFREYIQQKIRYPVKAAEAGIEGQVVVSFIINEKGKLINPKIVRHLDPLLDKEALRVISSSPTWTPGVQSGKAVSVQLTMPVVFKLKQDK
jgi:TonB family protein